MKIAGMYSLKHGQQILEERYGSELTEIKEVIAAVDSEQYRTKESKEKTKKGKMLYHPKSLNKAAGIEFGQRGWQKHKVACAYPTQYYTEEYTSANITKGAFREMDFVKNRVGVEVQFGKYAFMVYNVCAKMTIFHKLNVIDVGVEIVPVKEFAERMSSGVSYFEQFVWDLETRGIADIDLPVLVIGLIWPTNRAQSTVQIPLPDSK